ncbi:MAG TPA: NAD(P)-dependent oxidoreductase [Clostridia bacterium]|nr:NAD(P)-dependent oxidoreductase [Clostridia bacterium]
MKSVFITGAGGFIGRKLAEYLLDCGLDVTVLALPSEVKSFENNERIEVIEGDLGNPCEILAKLKNRSFDTMYHLAWVGVSTTFKNDISVQSKNINFAFNAMELARNFGCGRVICTGSVSEYAYAGSAVNGLQPPSPGDMYAATKAAVHTYCELLARQYEIGFNWILIPSIYGPGREDNNLITYTINTLLDGKKPSFTKLEQIWDYVYIDDVIKTLYLVGENGIGIKTYVTGYGQSRQLNSYVKIIRDAINPSAELGIGDLPYKTSRVDNAVVDISELQKDTGYMPEVDFETGIKRTIEYFRGRNKA